MASTPHNVAVGSESGSLTVQESYLWARNIARERARNFYYSFRLLSKEKHDAISAVYAFMRHCDDLSDEKDASREAIESWRTELDRALAGDLPPHPVWPGFVDAVQRFSIPHHIFHDMIEGVLSDLEPRRIQTFDELYQYCYQVASVVGLSVIHIFGFHDDRAPLLAEKCGIAFQLTNIIRDIKEDAERDRVYLPAADIARFRASIEEDSEELRSLLRYEGARARAYYDESRPLLEMVDKSSQASLRALMDIYSALLDRIEASDYDVLSRRISLPAWQKTWLMLRALI